MLRPANLRRDWRALLREFPRRPGAWRVLATNLVPIAGVLVLGWSAGIATLAFFADAIYTAMTLTAVLVVHAMDETMPHVRGVSRWLGMLFLWAFITPLLALPVFIGGSFALGWAGLDANEAWTALRTDRAVQLGFAGLAAGHVATGAAWLRREDRRRVRDELREAVGLLFFKVMVLAMLGAHVGFVFLLLGSHAQLALLLVIAAILTVAEVYRGEVLAMMGVDRRFHESCERSMPEDGTAATTDAEASAGVAQAAARRRRKRRKR